MKEKELLELLGTPTEANYNWAHELSERDVERINRDIKLYKLMLKRRSAHLNIYGLHVHLGNSFAAFRFADDFDERARNEILPYLNDIIESCRAVLSIGWLPRSYAVSGSGIIFNKKWFDGKYISMYISYNLEDVRTEAIPELNGSRGPWAKQRKFQNNYCVSCEQYKRFGYGLYAIFEHIDNSFKQHIVDGRKIKDLEVYQRRYWFKYDNELVAKFMLKNAEFIDGNLPRTIRMHISQLRGWERIYCMNICGDAQRITGDVSNIRGDINPGLYGDVSKLRGNITNVIGNATGVELDIDAYRLARRLNDGVINLDDIIIQVDCSSVSKYRTLTYKENAILMKAWRTLCYHTIGLEQDVYDKFDKPVKVKPPFPVDKWGRFYKEDDGTLYVYSVNPADIMLAKDVNKCATCFCLNSGREKWGLGMRCLIAETSVNPNLGVVLKFRKQEITKKLNQFKGIKFRWFDPDEASFFQYTSKNATCFYSGANRNLLPCFNGNIARGDIVPIWGHDGFCKPQAARQKELAYLETFIKPEYAWYDGHHKEFPLVNNYEDFYESEISDEWKEQIKRANNMADELRALIGTDKGDK